MSESSLKNKALKGAGWSALDNIASIGISFIVGLILARLLGPEEYGLIGILYILINISNSFVDGGFTNALIRKKNIKEIDYNTVFITNIVVSIFFSALSFLSANLIANFFHQPELVNLTRVVSFIIIINALAIVQKARLIKNIDFKTQTKVTLISSTVSGVVGIVMALQGCGVWSLVGQQISARCITTFLLWNFNRWIPSFQFSWVSFKEMWNFGWKLLASGLIETTWKEVYQIVIGKYYSPITLGYYTRAQQFSSLFSSNLTNVVQRVSYPVLSSIQDDRIKLKVAYQKMIKTTMLITFVLMLGLASISKAMVQVLIGNQWLPCVPMLKIICLNMMLYPLHAINLNMLQVQGRSDLFLKLEIIKKIVAVGPILLGVFFNIYWMLGGSVIAGLISYYLNAYYSGPFLKYSIMEQVKDILPSFAIATFMAVILYILSYLSISPFIMLPLQILSGALIIILLGKLCNLEEFLELKNICLSFLKKLKSN